MRAGTYLISSTVSRWVWAKQIPTFEEFMELEKKDKAMSDHEMYLQVLALNKAMGGTVVEKGGEEADG